jgi:hypothetical protein
MQMLQNKSFKKKPMMADINFSAMNFVPSQRESGNRMIPTLVTNMNSRKARRYSIRHKQPVKMTKNAVISPITTLPIAGTLTPGARASFSSESL